MIYKFTFEVTNDQNDHIFCMRKEESGNFWWAFTTFMHYVLIYASKQGLDRKSP
jgi:hypothetical protein